MLQGVRSRRIGAADLTVIDYAVGDCISCNEPAMVSVSTKLVLDFI